MNCFQERNSSAVFRRHLQSSGAICRRHLRLQAPLEAPFAALFQARFRCHVRRTPKAPIQALHQALFKAGLSHHLGTIGDALRSTIGDALRSAISGVVYSSRRAPVRLFLVLEGCPSIVHRCRCRNL